MDTRTGSFERPGHTGLRAEPVDVPAGYAAASLPVGAFPLDRVVRARLADVLWALGELIGSGSGAGAPADVTLWLLGDTLHRNNEMLHVSENGRDWKPSFGLGRWPDQPPPRTMGLGDLLHMTWGDKPRQPYHRVIRLDAEGPTQRGAWTTMFGTGSTILTLVPGGAAAMLDGTRAALTQNITDPAFRDFPFYFPLLNLRTLAEGSGPQLAEWLGPAVVYVRESEEDRAVVVVASVPQPVLDAALQQVLP